MYKRQLESIPHIDRLQHQHSYTDLTTSLTHRHKVCEAAKTDHLFLSLRYTECRDLCYEIVQAQPSEAVLARCHMYLATEAVGPGYPAGRAYHAAMAVQARETVTARTGTSRFPVAKAKWQLDVAKTLLHRASKDVDEEMESAEQEDLGLDSELKFKVASFPAAAGR